MRRTCNYGVDLFPEDSKVIIVFRAQFPLDKLPKPFNKVKVRAIRWDVVKVNAQFFCKVHDNLALLVAGIIQD